MNTLIHIYKQQTLIMMYKFLIVLLSLIFGSNALSCKILGRTGCILSCVAQNCASGYCDQPPAETCRCARCDKGPSPVITRKDK